MAKRAETAARVALVAALTSAGLSSSEVARRLGLSVSAVTSMKTKPAFTEALQRSLGETAAAIAANFAAAVSSEAAPTLSRLTQLRDQDENRAVALGAAKTLFAALLPATSSPTTASDQVSIKIELPPETLAAWRETAAMARLPVSSPQPDADHDPLDPDALTDLLASLEPTP